MPPRYVVFSARSCLDRVFRFLPASQKAADALAAALLTPTCVVCGRLLEQILSPCVCETCWCNLPLITPPVCDRCGDPVARPEAVCRACFDREHTIDRARSAGHYEGNLRIIIHAMKYHERRSLISPLAERMKTSGREILNETDAVVPVPLHQWRQLSRGFNQSAEMARLLGLPVLHLLRRTRHTRSQIELPAAERRANVQNAFALRRGWFRNPQLFGKRLALIDDVSTTGATLDACGRVLKAAGASKVFSLTAARVARRSNG